MIKKLNLNQEQGQSNLSPVILSGHTSPSVILSGREGSMDPSANAFRMTGETGRSMVGMLGVLAIIGVLSVGGIAGYKMAMNKHRANEILNGASMRAMTVSAQIQRNNKATPNLGEFTGNKVAGATFDTTVSYTAGTNTFALTVSGIDSDVCEQIHGTISTNGNVYINEECTTFTYNTDLTAGMTPGPVGKPCTGTQPEGTTCVNGIYVCSSNGQLPCKGVCCAAGSTCTGDGLSTGQCYEPTKASTKGCATNAECESGEFCYFSAYSNVGYQFECSYGPAQGQCKSIIEGEFKADKTLSAQDLTGRALPSAFVGKKYLNKGMNWWSAHNWCLAQGHTLMSKMDADTSDSDGLKALGYAVNESASSGVSILLEASETDSCVPHIVESGFVSSSGSFASSSSRPVCSG